MSTALELTHPLIENTPASSIPDSPKVGSLRGRTVTHIQNNDQNSQACFLQTAAKVAKKAAIVMAWLAAFAACVAVGALLLSSGQAAGILPLMAALVPIDKIKSQITNTPEPTGEQPNIEDVAESATVIISAVFYSIFGGRY